MLPVYLAVNVQRQQLHTVEVLIAASTQPACQMIHVFGLTLHTEYYIGKKHKTLCQAHVLWHHNALALRTSHSKMWSLVR